MSDHEYKEPAYSSLDHIVQSDKPRSTHSLEKPPLRDGSDSSGSTPSPPITPPSPYKELVAPPPSYSSGRGGNRSTPRRSQPTKILGAIDENGTGMAPDIPIRNPRRPHTTNYLKTPSFIASLFPSASPKLASQLSSDYDEVTGPRGEKFNDARQNRRSMEVRQSLLKRRWRTFMCIGLVLMIVVALMAIGLVVGLTVTKKKHHKNDDGNGSRLNGTDSTLTAFPVGTYTLTPFLLSVASACTPNAATWRCYPYQTYSQSQSGSMTTLDWQITGSNVSGDVSYSISASTNPFALPFSGADLTLVDRGLATERYTFQTILEKVVIPDASITSDGSTARCYYNSSMLMGDLYTKRQPDLRTGAANDQWWPHAVTVRQTAQGKPDCWKMVDGEDVERVSVDGEGTGECSCGYADFENS